MRKGKMEQVLVSAGEQLYYTFVDEVHSLPLPKNTLFRIDKLIAELAPTNSDFLPAVGRRLFIGLRELELVNDDTSYAYLAQFVRCVAMIRAWGPGFDSASEADKHLVWREIGFLKTMREQCEFRLLEALVHVSQRGINIFG